jgi:hypothetical protein
MHNIKVNDAKFNEVVDKDPMKLNKFARNENSSRTTIRHIYMLLGVVPLLLIIAFAFFMVASMDGAMFGTPEGEIDSIIQQKMKEIIDQSEKENGDSTGNIGDTF